MKRESSTIDLNEMASAYIEAALWADCIPLCADPTHPNYEDNWESGGLNDTLITSDDDFEYIKRLCTRFIATNWDDCHEYIRLCSDERCAMATATPSELLGHDLRLTSGGHGCGFWDRGMGIVGNRLTTAVALDTPFCRLGGGDCWQYDEETAKFDHLPLATSVEV